MRFEPCQQKRRPGRAPRARLPPLLEPPRLPGYTFPLDGHRRECHAPGGGERGGVIDTDVFVQSLLDAGFDFFCGVPDSLLGGIIETLTARRLYTPAVREDEAVAMAAGASLASKTPAVLMQNSGLGTSLNTILSLSALYRLPCLLLVSWRGFEGNDAPEHRLMGGHLTDLLDAARISHRSVSEGTYQDDVGWAAGAMHDLRVPVALLLKKGVVRSPHE